MAKKRIRGRRRRDGLIIKSVRKRRDYKAEYAQRITRWLSKGLTRSQARGHPRPTETLVSNRKSASTVKDAQLQHALRILRQEKTLKAAAKAANVSPERFRHTAVAKRAITRKGRRWAVNAKLPRRVLIYSRGKPAQITVGDFVAASVAGQYMSAVGTFLSTNSIDVLAPFAGQSVTDISGRAHPLETNPNVLYRLNSAGSETFESVYRIVV